MKRTRSKFYRRITVGNVIPFEQNRALGINVFIGISRPISLAVDLSSRVCDFASATLAVFVIYLIKQTFSDVEDINFISDIVTEKAPIEAAGYPHDKLGHVETNERNQLPSAQGEMFFLPPTARHAALCWLPDFIKKLSETFSLCSVSSVSGISCADYEATEKTEVEFSRTHFEVLEKNEINRLANGHSLRNNSAYFSTQKCFWSTKDNTKGKPKTGKANWLHYFFRYRAGAHPKRRSKIRTRDTESH